ncbi:hypothetical protein V6Z12_D12G188500 [Gossypium hirsutum]
MLLLNSRPTILILSPNNVTASISEVEESDSLASELFLFFFKNVESTLFGLDNCDCVAKSSSISSKKASISHPLSLLPSSRFISLATFSARNSSKKTDLFILTCSIQVSSLACKSRFT